MSVTRIQPARIDGSSHSSQVAARPPGGSSFASQRAQAAASGLEAALSGRSAVAGGLKGARDAAAQVLKEPGLSDGERRKLTGLVAQADRRLGHGGSGLASMAPVAVGFVATQAATQGPAFLSAAETFGPIGIAVGGAIELAKLHHDIYAYEPHGAPQPPDPFDALRRNPAAEALQLPQSRSTALDDFKRATRPRDPFGEVSVDQGRAPDAKAPQPTHSEPSRIHPDWTVVTFDDSRQALYDKSGDLKAVVADPGGIGGGGLPPKLPPKPPGGGGAGGAGGTGGKPDPSGSRPSGRKPGGMSDGDVVKLAIGTAVVLGGGAAIQKGVDHVQQAGRPKSPLNPKTKDVAIHASTDTSAIHAPGADNPHQLPYRATLGGLTKDGTIWSLGVPQNAGTGNLTPNVSFEPKVQIDQDVKKGQVIGILHSPIADKNVAAAKQRQGIAEKGVYAAFDNLARQQLSPAQAVVPQLAAKVAADQGTIRADADAVAVAGRALDSDKQLAREGAISRIALGVAQTSYDSAVHTLQQDKGALQTDIGALRQAQATARGYRPQPGVTPGAVIAAIERGVHPEVLAKVPQQVAAARDALRDEHVNLLQQQEQVSANVIRASEDGKVTRVQIGGPVQQTGLTPTNDGGNPSPIAVSEILPKTPALQIVGLSQKDAPVFMNAKAEHRRVPFIDPFDGKRGTAKVLTVVPDNRLLQQGNANSGGYVATLGDLKDDKGRPLPSYRTGVFSAYPGKGPIEARNLTSPEVVKGPVSPPVAVTQFNPMRQQVVAGSIEIDQRQGLNGNKKVGTVYWSGVAESDGQSNTRFTPGSLQAQVVPVAGSNLSGAGLTATSTDVQGQARTAGGTSFPTNGFGSPGGSILRITGGVTQNLVGSQISGGAPPVPSSVGGQSVSAPGPSVSRQTPPNTTPIDIGVRLTPTNNFKDPVSIVQPHAIQLPNADFISTPMRSLPPATDFDAAARKARGR